MDPVTQFIAGFMVITILAVFLACVPIFIIISMMLNHSQARMAEMMQQNQEWTINAIATLSDHHSEQMQQVMLNLFGEMKRLSGKIPAISPTPKQTTGPIKKLPTPSPILMTKESDEEKESPFSDD